MIRKLPIIWYTIYCLSFVVKNFHCFSSLPSFHEKCSLSQAYTSFHSIGLKTFTVVKPSTKTLMFFTSNNKQYTVLIILRLLQAFYNHVTRLKQGRKHYKSMVFSTLYVVTLYHARLPTRYYIVSLWRNATSFQCNYGFNIRCFVKDEI